MVKVWMLSVEGYMKVKENSGLDLTVDWNRLIEYLSATPPLCEEMQNSYILLQVAYSI